jgi:4-amino-4-deoxy-L-arabinose transferase-like glycosyltransferase
LHPSTIAKRGSLLLFFAVVAFYFYGLGHLPLVGPDEPRYAQVAREMFLRHDFVTPTLGGHLWFEKPALLYWMMIASFKLFGVWEWSARLPSALSGVLTVAAVFCIGRRVDRINDPDGSPGFRFWSALAAATSLGIIGFSRGASFDIILTMTTTWALTCFILYELEEPGKRRAGVLVGFYAFIGLSLLAKGLIGIVIPLGVAGLYYVFRRRFPDRKALVSLLWGLPIACAIAAVWYLPVTLKHGWPFIDQFFIQQQFARYVTNKYHHPAPIYYYPIAILLLSLPWTAFLIDGITGAVRSLWRPIKQEDDRSQDRMRQFLVFALAWLLVPLVFFSFSGSKLPGYILPALPAAALIVGERLVRLSSGAANRNWAVTATALFCFAFAIGGPLYGWRSGHLSGGCALLLVTLAGIAGGVALFSRRSSTAMILIAAATLGVVIVLLNCGTAKFVEQEYAKRLLELADSRGYGQAPIYGLQRDDRTPQFYASVRVVYGSDGEPILYEGPAQVISESKRRRGTVLAFVPLKELAALTESGSVQTDVIGDNGKVALVAVTARKS